MPEQVSLQGQVSVGPLPDGQMAIVIDIGGGRSYVIGMPAAEAEKIGKALTAPKVIQPTALMQNGRGHG